MRRPSWITSCNEVSDASDDESEGGESNVGIREKLPLCVWLPLAQLEAPARVGHHDCRVHVGKLASFPKYEHATNLVVKFRLAQVAYNV